MQYEVTCKYGEYHTNSYMQAKEMLLLWVQKYGFAMLQDKKRTAQITDSYRQWVSKNRPHYEITKVTNTHLTAKTGLGIRTLPLLKDIDDTIDLLESLLYAEATWTN